MASKNSINRSTHSTSTPSRNSSVMPDSESEQTIEHTTPPYWNEKALSEREVELYIGREFVHDLECLCHDSGTNLQQEPSKSDKASYATLPAVPQLEDVDFDNWKDGPSTGCYASFGDQWTTATVGVFGQLLQFSRVLGAGSSGMFCADHTRMWEPYLVEMRASRLEELSHEAFHCGASGWIDQPYGLRFPNLILKPDIQPRLRWTHWRWPRHEYSRGDFENHPKLKMTIQWMVHQGTLLQQCLLDNEGDDLECQVEFSKSMIIRDLDHLNPSFGFNEEGIDDQVIRPGPKRYSWICLHKLPDTKHESNAEAPDCETFIEEHPVDQQQSSGDKPGQKSTEKPETKSADHTTESKGPHGVSVISSVAINGQLQRFDRDTSTQRWSLCSNGPQTKETDDRPRFWEVVTAYEMRLLDKPDTDWETYIIPLQKMAVNKFLQEQQPQPLPICIPISLGDSRRDILQAREGPSESVNINTREGTMQSKQTDFDGTTTTQTTHVPAHAPSRKPDTSSEQLHQTSPHKHLTFAARRNLEHILSVCTMKVTPERYTTTVNSPLPNGLQDVDAVALTCGDMSGHRICWSASFFAFQFLVEFYKVLVHYPKEAYFKSILKRIQEACLGHLKWLHLIQHGETGQRFGTNYWVTGKLMVKPESSASWTSGESFLDTGLQVLKAAACMELCDDTNLAANLMSDWAPSWLVSLEKSDKRKKYAWPHAEKEGVNTFRLDEHVWIWRALKSLEMKNCRAWELMSHKFKEAEAKAIERSWAKVKGNVFTDGQDAPTPPLPYETKEELANLRETFASKVARREISSRFTTENTVLRKRMLATTRSIRESRFMLHSRDTALLYKELFDFLGENSSVKELWKTTIQSQMYHTEYQESTWEKTLRYALYIMLGSQGLRINKASPDALVRTATDTLMQSFSRNGFFHGRIEISSEEPVGVSNIAEEDMDSYYHASFEIPYILLTHFQKVSIAYTQRKLEAVKSRRHSDPVSGYRFPSKKSIPRDISMMQGDTAQRKILLHLSDILLGRSTISDLENHEVFREVRLTMKKSVPFDRLVDSSNIVKLEDEWLYKYPGFFRREEILKDDCDEGQKELQCQLKSSEPSDGQTTVDRKFRNFRSCIVDVRSSKRVEGKRKEHKPDYYEGGFDELKGILSRTRTAKASKKRLHSFVMVPEEFVLRCYNTTEASERLNMKDFFQRHARHSKHSFDHCSMVENYWESEFHLSHYQLLRKPTTLRHGIAQPESEPFPGGLNMRIVRASASFRFHGDFFDRHWTCYMLDSTPKGPITNPYLLKERTYCQRKVLEQRYFADILKSLTGSVGEILNETNRYLGVESGSFSTSIETTHAYSSWRADWQKFQPLLQKLHDDLASSQHVVRQWEAREEDRGKEKPRWTSNDERKYRGEIMTIRREIKHRKSQLQHLHEKTKSLQDLCSNRLDEAREDLTFRSEQNIATFTYVTVVFLPIGFTASIFSMNGSPETSLAIEMVIASVIALTVTVLALMNAKGLAGVLENIGINFEKLTAKAKRSSVIVRDQEVAAKEDIEPHPEKRKPSHPRVSPTEIMSWNLIFWTGYIFIELPARSITAACRAIGWPRDDPKDRKMLDESGGTEPDGAVVHEDASEESLSLPASKKSADDCEAGDQRSKSKFKYTKATARVILACFTVLVLMPAWILQILCFNAWDALALVGELMRKAISCFSLPEIDTSEARLMTHLTKPSKYFRPMGMWKDHLRSEKKPPQPQNSKKEGGEKIPDSSPEKTSRAPR